MSLRHILFSFQQKHKGTRTHTLSGKFNLTHYIAAADVLLCVVVNSAWQYTGPKAKINPHNKAYHFTQQIYHHPQEGAELA